MSNKVSDKVKKQIWGNEYVDFAVIFHNSTSDDDQYTFKVQNRKGGQPTFSLEQSIKKQPIHTIDQWTAAFQAFVAVYSERFSSETINEVLCYSERPRGTGGQLEILWRKFPYATTKRAHSMGSNSQRAVAQGQCSQNQTASSVKVNH